MVSRKQHQQRFNIFGVLIKQTQSIETRVKEVLFYITNVSVNLFLKEVST